MHAEPIDRTLLLPKSGVGVFAPWLVIAPPDTNQVIRLDLRLLDRIELIDTTQSAGASHTEENAAESPTSQGGDRLDLLLVCDDVEVAVFIADGLEACRRLAQQAAPHTREVTKVTSSGDLNRFVVVDEDPVSQRGNYLEVGNVAFRINEVREYALRGANIPLTQGRLLQAAIAMLVVAAAERDLATSP